MEQEHGEGQGVNILLVDDQPKNLSAIEAILAPLGQTLIKAYSGEEALKSLLDREFAVILLDVNMPGMNGFETARIIRERDQTSLVPIIFVTAHDADLKETLRGYELGAVDFIFKPIEVNEIIRSKVSVFVQLYEAKQRERERKQRDVLELQKALDHYKSMTGFSPLAVSGGVYGVLPLSKSAMPIFDELVEKYGHALDMALEKQIVEVPHDIPGYLRQIAEDLGFYRAGPRDIVEIHTTALASRIDDIPARKAQGMAEEGRFLVLQLMGELVLFYRRHYFGAEITFGETAANPKTDMREPEKKEV